MDELLQRIDDVEQRIEAVEAPAFPGVGSVFDEVKEILVELTDIARTAVTIDPFEEN